MAMGQATGVAAAMALRGALPVQDIDGIELAIALAERGLSGIADTDLAGEAG
jgi:hypothetical protein